MKWIVLLLVFTFPRCMQAAVPPGKPGSAGCTTAEYRISFTQGTWAKAWFCDKYSDGTVAHRWVRYGYGGLIVPDLLGKSYEQWLQFENSLGIMTDEQLRSYWVDTFENKLTMIDPASPDHAAYALYSTIKPPSDPPPSGLVTIDTKAYKQSPTINGYKVTETGSVPLGKPCTAVFVVDATGKRYHALAARTDATMKKINNYTPPYPTTLYGVCQP